jgi:nucleotide-binding universal stress UspA family protein
MHTRVLLPFDGSPAAIHAAQYVARNLQGVDASVVLLNVQSVAVDVEMAHAVRHIAQIHRVEAERILRKASDVLEAAGVDFSTEVALGPPAEVIARFAADRGFDVIVMGNRARHPLVELFRRSVSKQVAQRSRVPVLMVSTREKLLQAPPRWDRAPYIAA